MYRELKEWWVLVSEISLTQMLKIKKRDFNKSFDKVNHDIFMNNLRVYIALYYNLIHLLNNDTKSEE